MNKTKSVETAYTWIPGNGPDQAARLRLLKAFKRPDYPMGEAWFMSDDRKMYPDALEKPFDELDPEMLSCMFDEIVTGSPCFGQLPEWRDWFHYLMPRLVPLALQMPSLSYVAEWLASATFSQHPNGLEGEMHAGFRNDMLVTLGRVLMSSEIWEGYKLKWQGGLFQESQRYAARSWYLDQASPPISALLFFCLKYLRPDEIAPWFRSVLNIGCPLWRSQLIVWLTGARPLLLGEILQPKALENTEPSVVWEWSYIYSGNYSGDFSNPLSIVTSKQTKTGDGAKTSRKDWDIPFIPQANLQAFRDCFYSWLPRGVRSELSEQVLQVPLLSVEMGHIALQFVDFELGRSSDS